MQLKRQHRIHRLLARITSAGATGAWLSIALITFIDVVGRELFSRPIPGGYEIIQTLMAVGLFTSFPIVALYKGHVTVRLFQQFFPINLLRVTEVVAKLASVVFFGFLAYSLVRFTLHAFSAHLQTVYLSIPYWAVAAFMTVFIILTTACCLVAQAPDEPQADTGDK